MLTRIKIALNAKSEEEAINFVMKQFDHFVELTEATSSLAGHMNIEQLFGDD